MKKKNVAILTFLFSLFFSFSFRSPEVVSANSASRVTLGTDSNGVVSKSENCPLEVKGEKLNFYVSSFPILPDQPSGGAYLSAEYTFYNPTDLDIDAELVFPFGAAPEYSDGLDDLSDFDVLINGEVVEKELRHTYSSSYAFDLDRDMSKIRDEMIEDAFFRKNADVFHYRVEALFDPEKESLPVRASFSTLKGLIAPDRCSINGNTVSFPVERNKIYDFYFVGEDDPDFIGSASLYESSDSHLPLDGRLSLISKEEMLFDDLIFKYYDENAPISRLDWNNAFYDRLADDPNRNGRIISLDESEFDLAKDDRLLRWYDYRLKLRPGESATNTVFAPLYPSINDRYEPAKYEYTYLLSPAKSWADFQNLDIAIYTDFYISDSTLRFEQNEDGTGYSAHCDTLPETELRFSLCEVSRPKIVQNASYWILWALLIGLVVFVVACVILAIVPTILLIWRLCTDRNDSDRALRILHLSECLVSLGAVILSAVSFYRSSVSILCILFIPYFLVLFALLLVERLKFRFPVSNRMVLLVLFAILMIYNMLSFTSEITAVLVIAFSSVFILMTAMKSLKKGDRPKKRKENADDSL